MKIRTIIPKQMVVRKNSLEDKLKLRRSALSDNKNQTSLVEDLSEGNDDDTFEPNIFENTNRSMKEINNMCEKVFLDFDKLNIKTPEMVLSMDFGGKIVKNKQREQIDEMLEDVRKQKR